MQILFSFAALFLLMPAHALDTAKCPAQVQLSYEDLIPVSDEKIDRLKTNANGQAYPESVRARERVTNATNEDLRDLAFEFTGVERGACQYKGNQRPSEMRIYARRGQDYMRVRLPLNGQEIYTVQPLTRVDLRGLRFDYRPVTPIFVTVGDGAFHVGWAYSLSIKN